MAIYTSQYGVTRLLRQVEEGLAALRGTVKASYLYSNESYYIVDDLVDQRTHHVPTWLWDIVAGHSIGDKVSR